MQLPNLLASKWGRLIAFFFLYVTEGIPLGFTSTAIATQLRRSGVGVEEISFFIGWLYFPWAWKWVMGPVVDLFYSKRLGQRRGWIIGTQIMMVLTLVFCVPLELNGENLNLLTSIILIHNFFCATQDVAIDALACTTLHSDERGLANGLMFAGQTLGIPLGGACVLYLLSGVEWLPMLQDGIPMQQTYFFVAGCIFAVTLFIAIPMREAPLPPRASDGEGLSAQLVDYVKTAKKEFFGSRAAFAAFILALLPAGAVALNLALQKTLAVEIGMADAEIADLEIVSSIVWALSCVLGGLISDRVGHLKSLAVFLVLMSIPTVWLAGKLTEFGVIMPVEIPAPSDSGQSDASPSEGTVGENSPAENGDAETSDEEPVLPVAESTPLKKDDRPPRSEQEERVVTTFWWAVMFYMSAQGLMYGTRAAIFMRVSNPVVAATQFTAYMSMMNLVIMYSAWWQGAAIVRWGYPAALYIDAATGVIGVVLLPLFYQRASRDYQRASEDFGD